MAKKSDEVWEKPAPRKSKHTKLSATNKAKAKASAKKAGRPYPSLVDNINAAKAQKKESGRKKGTASRATKPSGAKAKSKTKTSTPKARKRSTKTKNSARTKPRKHSG